MRYDHVIGKLNKAFKLINNAESDMNAFAPSENEMFDREIELKLFDILGDVESVIDQLMEENK